MIDSQPTIPDIIPQATEPTVHGPVATPSNPPPHTKIPIKIIVLVLCISGVLIAAMMLVNKTHLEPQSFAPTATPTPTMALIVTRPQTIIATSSAFEEFEAKLDEVTRGIQNAPIDNHSLLPPTIDLPLGF